MKKFIIISVVISIIVFVGIKVYKKKLMQKVMEGYNVDESKVADKSIKDLKAMLKALENKK